MFVSRRRTLKRRAEDAAKQNQKLGLPIRDLKLQETLMEEIVFFIAQVALLIKFADRIFGRVA